MIKGLKDVNIVTEDGVIKGNIELKEGIISNITSQSIKGLTFDQEVYVLPGFIDTHVHGANGSDTMDKTIKDLDNISKTLAREGTTAFLATTITEDKTSIIKALENVHQYMKGNYQEGAKLLGVHLEGPFINKGACGAQPRQYIIDADIELFEEFQKASGHSIKIVTIAPEIKGGLALIEYCHKHQIVTSIGHTLADYDTAVEAIHKGVTSITHCFNAMTGFHHRHVGVVGASFLHDEVDAELIADGIHVSKEAIQLLYKNKGIDKISLVTDAMRAKGLPDGLYELGKQQVFVKNKKALLKDGTLAGSVLPMVEAVKNIKKYLNIEIKDISKLVSVNPAKKLGIYNKKGSISIGKDADLVLLDKDYNIIMTICEGRIIYQRS